MTPEEIRGKIAQLGTRLDGLALAEEMPPEKRAQIASTLDAVGAEFERDLLPDLRTSTDPERKDEGARFFRRLAQANSWLDGRSDFSKKWIDLASEIAASTVLRDLIVSEQSGLRDPEAFAGLRELCQSGRVDKARRLLASRLRATSDPVARKRIQEVLADPRNFLAPIKSAPTMITYNGIGTSLHGERSLARDGTYVATLYLVVLFIPILPLRSYLVRRADKGWGFIGRVPLGAFAFWWRRLLVTVPVLLGLAIWGLNAWNASPGVREGRILATAAECLGQRQYFQALKHLGEMAHSTDPERAARRDALARRIIKEHWSTVRDPVAAGSSMAVLRQIVPDGNRGWVEGEASVATEQVVDDLRSQAHSATAIRSMLEWLKKTSKDATPRLPALTLRVCESIDDPALLALSVDSHARVGAACSRDMLQRLRAHLLKSRHESWNADALTYLRAADPADSGAVLDARIQETWTGAAPDPSLLELKNLPEPLRRLIVADAEPETARRVDLLEKTAEATGLEEPRKKWHQLGVARRLSSAYESLNEQDPVKYPLSKSLPWALKAVELDPDNLETRRKAVRGLVMAGEFEKADAIAKPCAGDPGFVFLVGLARARLGRLDEAAAVLRPYVEREFPAFATAEENWKRVYLVRTEELWARLRNGSADQAFIQRLNRLPQAQANAEAQDWVTRQLKSDTHLEGLLKAVSDLADVQAAANELAMVELSLGQSAPPGPGRTARFSAAEKLFRELRRLSPDDANQELRLGQVCFWLGKEAEGAEIFKRLREAGDGDVLHEMGQLLRQLGREEEAREVLEAAYEKTADPHKKSEIAISRSQTSKTLDDELAWLERSDAGNPFVRAEMDNTRARMEMERGNFKAAVDPLKRVAAYYAGLPETQTSLNNAAVNQNTLARATGDVLHQVESLKFLRRAHEKDPQSAIPLNNYIDALEGVAAATLAGGALRADLLHEIPQLSWMEWRLPLPTREERVKLAKDQPEFRRAADLGARLVILGPDRQLGYRIQADYFLFTRDAAALRRLRFAVEAAPPAMKEEGTRARDEARGVYSEGLRKSVERILAGRLSLLPGIRKEGHGPTTAYALLWVYAARVYAERVGVAAVEPGANLRDVEEAVAACDNYITRRSLATVRMDEAARGVASADPGFEAWIKGNPSVSPGSLLILYLRKNPDRAEAVRKREDAARAVQALVDLEKFPARGPWLRGWAWLDFMGHPSRVAARQSIRSEETLMDEIRLDFLLDRESPNETLDQWLAADATGDKELMESTAANARAAGILPMFFGK
jgi:tetratricopeptide (TPR) repeat protein